MLTRHYVIVTGAGAPRKDACFVGRIYECQNINDLEVENIFDLPNLPRAKTTQKNIHLSITVQALDYIRRNSHQFVRGSYQFVRAKDPSKFHQSPQRSAD